MTRDTVMSKKVGIVAFLFTAALIASFTPFYSNPGEQRPSNRREQEIQTEVFRQIETFHDYLKDTLFVEVSKKDVVHQNVRQAFLKSRLLFKRFEWAAEYFTADLTKRLNGAPVQEIENADLLDSSIARAVDPMGLQVIEQFIYPQYETTRKKELVSEVEHLIKNTEYLSSYFADHQLSDWRILDAAKLEVFRIIALGITGFDNSLSLNGIEESSSSLASLRDVVSFYATKRNKISLLWDLSTSIEYLHLHPDFNSFDRAVFITRYANKVSAAIAQLEQDLSCEKITYNRMLRQEATTLFDSGAFNADAFLPDPAFTTTDAKARLGEKLFYDVLLSGTGTRSCASCHQPDLSFTDGLARDTDIHDPAKRLLRNVPTLLNVALQSNYFYDMRALTLEDQVRDVISNKSEMDGSFDDIMNHVSADQSYQVLFAKAFPAKTEEGISANEVTNALASYVRGLTKLNSRFDEYMRGDQYALSKEELQGFNLFTGKAKCATCHFVPLFNGITPPKYVESETEVLGVPGSMSDSTLDPDPGYFGVIGVDSYKYAFKVPTVRNISKTTPYMHNGVYETLDQVMEFYNNGGATGLGINLPNQTLPEERLGLTIKEKEDVIAFMKSLESK